MASKDIAFTINVETDMDQEQQRDYAEEAANRALLHEEEVTPEDPYAYYKADLSEYGLRIADDMSEVEFYVDPVAWPTLRKKIDAAYEEYVAKQDLEEAFDAVQKDIDEARAATDAPAWWAEGRPPSKDQLQ